MATHSSILAWKIPWTEEPGGLQSIGSQESIGLQVLDMTKHTHIKSIKNTHQKTHYKKKKKTLQTARAMYGKQHISFYLILLSKQKNKEPPVLMGIHPQKMMQS